MPVVPTLEQPRVQAQTLRPNYSNLDTRGTHGEAIAEGAQNLARGLGQVASAASKIYEEEVERQTQSATYGALGTFQSESNTALDDPDKGFLRRRGEEAIVDNPVQPLLEGLEKRRQEILNKLPNERAKERFNAQSAGMLESARMRALHHVGQQTDEVERANVSLFVSSSLDGIVGVYASEKERTEYFQKTEAAIRSQRLPQGVIDGQVAEFKKRGHQAVLERYLVAEDIKGAQDYFSLVAPELGQAGNAIKARLESEARTLEGATEASKIFSESMLEGGVWVDPMKAFDKANALPEGPRKQEVMKHLKEKIELREALKKKAGEEALNALYSIQSTKGTTHTPEGRRVRAWMAYHPNGAADLLNRFDKEQESERRAQLYWDSQSRRDQDEKDRNAIALFQGRPLDVRSKATPEGIDAEFVGYASPRARNEMKARQQEAAKEAQRNAGVGETEFVTYVNGKAKDLHFGKGQSEALRNRLLDRRWTYRRENDNKEPTRQLVSEWVAEELLYGDFGEDGYGQALSGNKYKFQVEPEERESFRPFKAEEQPFVDNRLPAAAAPPGSEPPAASQPAAAPPSTTGGRTVPAPTRQGMPAADRARQLRASGFTPEDIVKVMAEEGYRK